MSSVFFLPAEPGERFCIFHPSSRTDANAGFVYAHPFCEEMNKARREAALQARRLADAGIAVLQIDLFGCGDSSGDFVDARWEIWKRDLQFALRWLRDRVCGPLGLWGLRLGATLVADVARDPTLGVEQLLLWQPVVNGEQFLTQFLRLRLAAEMLADGPAHKGVGKLRETLTQGTSLEIAGYELHPELAAAIDQLRLADFVPAVKHVYCLEIARDSPPRLLPTTNRVLEIWRSKGLDVRATAVTGEPFWSTAEVTECETLLVATEASLTNTSLVFEPR